MTRSFNVEDFEHMDPDLLRAIIREKAHHTVEFPLYQALFAGQAPTPRMGEALRKLLDVWEARGLPTNKPDLQWCYTLLRLSEAFKAGERPEIDRDAQAVFSETERATVERVIRTRRSIRVWQNRPVPRLLIEQVIEAGLWAPHACNLQTLRFIILEGAAGHALFRSGEITGWANCIAVAQDMRIYERFTATVPEYNRDLDCGAGMQNMLLTAHSLGLGADWGTFAPGETEAIRAHFGIAEHFRLRTYLALGWPAQVSLPPGRISPQDAILAWQAEGSGG